MILFEDKHLTKNDIGDALRLLHKLNYGTIKLSKDTFAYLN